MGIASLGLLEDGLRVLFELLHELHVLGRDSGHRWVLLGHENATGFPAAFRLLFSFRILLICTDGSGAFRDFLSLRGIDQERQVLFGSFLSYFLRPPSLYGTDESTHIQNRSSFSYF